MTLTIHQVLLQVLTAEDIQRDIDVTYRFFHAAEVEQQEAASKTPEQLAAEAASIDAITHPKTHQELLHFSQEPFNPQPS